MFEYYKWNSKIHLKFNWEKERLLIIGIVFFVLILYSTLYSIRLFSVTFLIHTCESDTNKLSFLIHIKSLKRIVCQPVNVTHMLIR